MIGWAAACRRTAAWLPATLALMACGATSPHSTGGAAQAYSLDCRASSATARPTASSGSVTYGTMVVAGRLRDYRLFQPPSTQHPVAPLVVVLHGSPIDAAGFEAIIHFQAEAAANGFFAVYPDGCFEAWDANPNSYDVAFVSQLIQRLEGSLLIDHNRIYVTGASAGGIMGYRLACDLTRTIAAFASITGAMPPGDCHPSRPISILEMHGTADVRIPYQGEDGQDSVPQLMQYWVAVDGCSGSPVLSESGITTISLWNRCAGGAAVKLETVNGGHHTWFGSTFDPVPGEPDSNSEAGGFLKQFALSQPGAASPTPDAAERSYVALIQTYWAALQAADEVSAQGGNVAARVCLGQPSAGAATDLSVVDPGLCAQRAAAILDAQQQFLSRLTATTAPPLYAADDRVFRAQIPIAIDKLRALITVCATEDKQAVVNAAYAYVEVMIPAVADALDDVDPSVAHH